MTVWKFRLDVTDIQNVSMPEGAKILTAQIQHGSLQLWALVDPESNKELRTIAIYGTGNPIPGEPGRYISSFQMLGGNLVFHVFELLEDRS